MDASRTACRGFTLLEARDTTQSAATLSKRWHDARERRKPALVEAESEANFDGLQRFLAAVHTLTVERRLLRHGRHPAIGGPQAGTSRVRP